jgi:uncharacterized protein (DUF58 family)
MNDDPKRYLHPLTLAKVRGLELKARLIVEGYLSGMHKSPYHGFSVEFAQHRISESMHYGSTEGMTKYDYACTAAAALAYLVLHQADSVGFVTFDSQVRTFMKPSSQPSHLKEMVTFMNQGAGREKSHMAPLFHDLAERINRRALIFLLSDMFDEVPEILAGFQHLRHKRHEVILWHILDSAELTFPFQEATLFRGLEQYPELLTDPRSLRDSYLEQVESFVKELQRGCRDQNIDYVQLRTDTPLNVALSSYLGHRLTRSK